MFAESLINFESLLPLALFGTFAALAWWGLDFMTAGKPRAMERLEELADPRKRRNAAAESALKKIRRLDASSGKGVALAGQTAATEERGGSRQTENANSPLPGSAANRPAASFWD